MWKLAVYRNFGGLRHQNDFVASPPACIFTVPLMRKICLIYNRERLDEKLTTELALEDVTPWLALKLIEPRLQASPVLSCVAVYIAYTTALSAPVVIVSDFEFDSALETLPHKKRIIMKNKRAFILYIIIYNA